MVQADPAPFMREHPAWNTRVRPIDPGGTL